jgi:AcrR family transcriptional regulator
MTLRTPPMPPTPLSGQTQARGDTFVSRVLQATLAQLAEVGFERLTIPAVALAADVNKTSIYRRWATPAALVRDAIGMAMQATDAAPDTGSLRGDLRALALGLGAFMASPIGAAIFRVSLVPQAAPELQAIAQLAYAQPPAHVAQTPNSHAPNPQPPPGPWQAIARARERGELKPHTQASVLLFALAGSVLHRVFVEKGAVDEAFVDAVLDLLLSGAGQ